MGSPLNPKLERGGADESLSGGRWLTADGAVEAVLCAECSVLGSSWLRVCAGGAVIGFKGL